MSSVSIIIPVYNEESVIGRVVEDALSVLGDQGEVLVVDDGSSDRTAEIAGQAHARVICHPYNMGNGAAIKTGIRQARFDALILMDGDGQHGAKDITRLLNELKHYDLVVGARSRNSHQNIPRYLANRIYNLLASYLTGVRIEDLTSGFRAIRRPLARKFLSLLPNRFSYPTTITLAIIKAGFSLKYVPIETAPRVGKSRLRFFKDGMQFFAILLKLTTLYSPFRIFFPISILFLISGAAYYFYSYAMYQRLTNITAVLFINALLVFLMGLISEQIAQMRFERMDNDKDQE